jgi:hypothetical protein
LKEKDAFVAKKENKSCANLPEYDIINIHENDILFKKIV